MMFYEELDGLTTLIDDIMTYIITFIWSRVSSDGWTVATLGIELSG